MCLYNMAIMGFRDYQIIEKLVNKGMQSKVIDEMTPRDFSNLIFALSAMKYRDFEKLEPLKNALSRPDVIQYFTPAQITNFMHCSAKLS